MHSVHLIIDNAPEFIAMPEALRGRRVECIFVPLDDTHCESVPRAMPKFNIAEVGYERESVSNIVIPSREDRNARYQTALEGLKDEGTQDS